MSILIYSNLKVGQEVAVVEWGYFGMVHQGKYSVIKADKCKVLVQNVADKSVRKFSVITRKELTNGASNSPRLTCIVPSQAVAG